MTAKELLICIDCWNNNYCMWKISHKLTHGCLLSEKKWRRRTEGVLMCQAKASGKCPSVQCFPMGPCWVAYILNTQTVFPYGPQVYFAYIKAATIEHAWMRGVWQHLCHQGFYLLKVRTRVPPYNFPVSSFQIELRLDIKWHTKRDHKLKMYLQNLTKKKKINDKCGQKWSLDKP